MPWRTGGRVRLSDMQVHCAVCPLSHRCWGVQLTPVEGIRAKPQPQLERGAELIRQGEESRAIYLVVTGCLILRETPEQGIVRTAGFRVPGEVVGMEGWATGRQSFTAVATGMTSVCRLLLPPPATGSTSAALLERLLVKCTAQVDRSAKFSPGLPALERVAAFLEDFAQRARIKGSVNDLLKLPMTRADIGSYLGLAEETVVRAIGELRSRQWLSVNGRTVRLRSFPDRTRRPGSYKSTG